MQTWGTLYIPAVFGATCDNHVNISCANREIHYLEVLTIATGAKIRHRDLRVITAGVFNGYRRHGGLSH
jgi:hypothetical protein